MWDRYQDKRQLKLEGKEVQRKAESQKVVINTSSGKSSPQKESNFSAFKSIASKVSSVKQKLIDSSREVDGPVKEEPRIGEPVQVKANKKQLAAKENNPYLKKGIPIELLLNVFLEEPALQERIDAIDRNSFSV